MMHWQDMNDSQRVEAAQKDLKILENALNYEAGRISQAMRRTRRFRLRTQSSYRKALCKELTRSIRSYSDRPTEKELLDRCDEYMDTRPHGKWSLFDMHEWDLIPAGREKWCASFPKGSEYEKNAHVYHAFENHFDICVAANKAVADVRVSPTFTTSAAAGVGGGLGAFIATTIPLGIVGTLGSIILGSYVGFKVQQTREMNRARNEQLPKIVQSLSENAQILSQASKHDYRRK